MEFDVLVLQPAGPFRGFDLEVLSRIKFAVTEANQKLISQLLSYSVILHFNHLCEKLLAFVED